MKIAVLFALVFFANATVKPDRNSAQTDAAPNGERAASVVFANNDNRSYLAQDNHKETPKGDGAIQWANWALVAVGFVTFLAILKQAIESGRATEAMRKSIELQAIGMKQWLQTEDWRLDAEFPDRHAVSLKCKIVNPTNLPLTLGIIKFQFSLLDGEQTLDTWAWAVAPRTFYPFRIPYIQLFGKFLDDFDKERFDFWIRMSVDFTDAFGKRQNQVFSYTGTAGRHQGCKVVPRIGAGNPTEKSSQNPN